MKTIRQAAVVVMNRKITKRFCSSMLVFQFICFALVQYSPYHNLWFIPANFWLLLFVFCGGVGAIIGIGLSIKAKFDKTPFDAEQLVVFLICLSSVMATQLVYGWQTIDLNSGNDYSTDVINPPQFDLSRRDRSRYQLMPSFWGFMDIPHKVLKSDTDSLVLSMSGFDSKIVVKQVINKLGWMFVRLMDKNSTSEGFNETYLLSAGSPGIAGRTDLAVRVVSNNEGFSVVDIHSSSSHSRRDLGFNELMILRLNKEILLATRE